MPTDKQIEEIALRIDGDLWDIKHAVIYKERIALIEKTIRKALTAAEKAQEAQPVAWRANSIRRTGAFALSKEEADRYRDAGWEVAPLYTSPTIPEGWQLVPIEPAENMLSFVKDELFGGSHEDTDELVSIYRAMLAASPLASTAIRERNEATAP